MMMPMRLSLLVLSLCALAACTEPQLSPADASWQAHHAASVRASDLRVQKALVATDEAQKNYAQAVIEVPLRAQREQTLLAIRVVRERVHHDIATWQASILERCTSELSSLVCSEAPVGTPDDSLEACRAQCNQAKVIAVASTFDAAETACIEGYVASRSRFQCSVSVPPRTDLSGEEIQARLVACSEACALRAPPALFAAKEGARVLKDGPALVLAYKRCMVAADSTPLARKYQAYDRDLYETLISQADAACQSANRCEWIGKFSPTPELACTYTY